ncbi:hypothetical protein Syun_025660 [Stephania yunnanensis]|uniref:Uncharacterized protein n=1 Tax=Stephania yunnanensis TaxID=152371 RepID=A0AAP0EUP1_9MAGN
MAEKEIGQERVAAAEQRRRRAESASSNRPRTAALGDANGQARRTAASRSAMTTADQRQDAAVGDAKADQQQDVAARGRSSGGQGGSRSGPRPRTARRKEESWRGRAATPARRNRSMRTSRRGDAVGALRQRQRAALRQRLRRRLEAAVTHSRDAWRRRATATRGSSAALVAAR